MMPRPSDRTHRVYGVSFSAANFVARSSDTTASFAMTASAQRAHAGPAQVALHHLRRQDDGGIVLGRVLDLLEVIQATRLEDAIDDRDDADRLLRAGIEVLVDRVGR